MGLTKQQRRVLLSQRIDDFTENNGHLQHGDWRRAFEQTLRLPENSLIGIIKNNGGGNNFNPYQHLDELLDLMDENKGNMQAAPTPQMDLFNQ